MYCLVCITVSILLFSGLTEILTSSRNYTELKEAWIKWRNVSGKLMKEDYAHFVNLSNKAVQQLGKRIVSFLKKRILRVRIQPT